MIVFTTGTFDVLHYGHINLLKKASEKGVVIVGLNVTKNGKPTYYTYNERKLMLEALRYVDVVVPIEKQEDKFKYIKQYECDLFIIGSDYIGYKDIPEIEKLCKVEFIERTPDISSTSVKRYLKARELSDNTKYNRYVIDLDDTICFTENRDFENSKPYQEVIDKINELYEKGWEIIIYTARGAKSCTTILEREKKYRSITEEWLKKHKVRYTELVFGKMNADYYVDDKNLSIEEFLK